MAADDQAMAEGARNLLLNCADVVPGDSLLILHEDPDLGWYDDQAPEAVAREAEARGLAVTRLQVQAPGQNGELADRIDAAMASHGQTVFFARLGDEGRFAPQKSARPPVMSYALTADMLASAYGRYDHKAFLALKAAVNKTLDAAGEIRLTCPLGTDLKGRLEKGSGDGPEDVAVKRFPVTVYKPVPTAGFSGRVALSRYLAPTGSRPYSPAVLPFEGVVFADIERGRITGFEGPPAAVTRIGQHYDHVAGLFGIEPMVSHSWHSGLHPACAYDRRAAEDPDRWCNTVFGNPRILHFHTCGDYAPGEISWTVVDPTISLDGRDLWHKGVMDSAFNDRIREAVANWPGLADMLRRPSPAIGL